MSQGASAKVVVGEAAASTTLTRIDQKGSDAATCYAGNPNFATTDSWAADQIGALLFDTTTAAQPVLKQFAQLAAAGPTYGLRTLRIPKVLWPADHIAVVAATSTSVDVAYTTASTTFNTDLQDSGQVEFLVKSLTVVVRCRFTSSSHPGGDKLFVGIERADGTFVRKVYCPPTVNVWTEQEIEIPLTSGEAWKYAVDTNAGGNTVEYAISYKRGTEQV